MIKFMINKLSRDKSLESFKAQNITCNYKSIESKEFIDALVKKLIEESYEVKETDNKQELISELADVLEVFYSLCKAHNLSLSDIEKARQEKYTKLGSYQKGFYIETIEMDENNPRVEHFRKNPKKYPEIK